MNELRIALPEFVLGLTACLLFLVGMRQRHGRCWGIVSLVAIAVSAGTVAYIGNETIAPVGSLHQSSLLRNGSASVLEWMSLAVAGLIGGMMWPARDEDAPQAEQWGLLLLAAAAAMTCAIANDLIVLFTAVELLGLSLTVLILVSRRRGDVRRSATPAREKLLRDAAVKQFVLGLVAGGLLLQGFAFVYALTGSTNLAVVRSVLTASYRPPDPALAVGSSSWMGVAAVVLIVASCGYRLGVVPMHFARVELWNAVRFPIACAVSVLSMIAGYAVLDRVVIGSQVGFEATGQLLLLVFSIATLLVGGIGAAQQVRPAAIPAFLLTVQAGFVTAALAVSSWETTNAFRSNLSLPTLPSGASSALFVLGTGVLAACGLSAALTYLERRDRSLEHVDELRGLIRQDAPAALCCAVALGLFCGFPPLVGFWSRLLVLLSMLRVHVESSAGDSPAPHTAFVVLAGALLLSTLLIAVVCLRVLTVLFLDEPTGRVQPGGRNGALCAAILVALTGLALGLLPGPLIGALGRLVAGK